MKDKFYYRNRKLCFRLTTFDPFDSQKKFRDYYSRDLFKLFQIVFNFFEKIRVSKRPLNLESELLPIVSIEIGHPHDSTVLDNDGM